MEVSFATKRLRECCEKEEEARLEYGDETALFLKKRLADIRAAEVMTDLVAGSPRPLNDVFYLLKLGEDARLILESGHARPPTLQNGVIDWSKVKRIKVIEIEINDA